MAPFVPGPDSEWGATFTIKLVAVGGLLLGSLVRTLVVLRWRTPDEPSGDRLERIYAATTAYLLGLVALAVVLAHG